VDEFTQDTRYMANGWSEIEYRLPESQRSEYTVNPLRQFGTRCDISKDGHRKFMLTFVIDKPMAAFDDRVYTNIKVDEFSPFTFTAHLFTNSNNAGYIELDRTNAAQMHRFISQARAGYTMTIRIHNQQQSFVEDYSVLLRGFTKHTAGSLRACAVSVAPSRLTAYDRRRIKEINQQIDALEAEKMAIMEKY
jgi:hypothetical protein